MNIDKNSYHTIAGITCRKQRYIYNGWRNANENTTPCNLMKHPWNISHKKGYFCLHPYECVIQEGMGPELCYNFTKGERYLTYVKRKHSSDYVSPVYDSTPRYEPFARRGALKASDASLPSQISTYQMTPKSSHKSPKISRSPTK